MLSLSASLIHLYIKYIRASKAVFGSAQRTREQLHDLYLHPQSFSPPAAPGPDISIQREDVTDWPLYRVSSSLPSPQQQSSLPTPSRNAESRGSDLPRSAAMLYLHGGAFYREIDPGHWTFISQAARETGLDVLVPIYPLLPRPGATASNVVSRLEELVRLLSRKQRIVSIAGDSAGGCIALALAQRLVASAPDVSGQLSSVVLISPVLDLALDNPEAERLDPVDPWLGLAGLRAIAPLWAGELPVRDPRVSPLYGAIEGLPPVMLLSGTMDLLNPDARRLSGRFQGMKDGGGEKGVKGSVELERFVYVEGEGMVHVYPLLPHWEGGVARERIMGFVRGCLV
ncbi:hypothetical protein B5807_02917 [Epicoccum nigrum]|uniref:Alpha/beta hydrolase fold-3 domain-containing protein n=1 Tax=Epicoccum nigrum TaxID=105696 RepID=A0A1Y2MA46_EPING|nr:hypothetical protein B5807_02917 [Epicoccum nigrum]